MNITNRITSATFSACITNKEGLPKDDLPIVALVGRSNVGKSSLINSLTGRKELARTSSMPGKTLTMNFYCINDAFYIVDLPGYGYAKASKATRNKIQSMMDEFFTSCSNLKGVVQIVDIRHKPTTLDMQMHNWLREQRFNGFVVLTKADKLSNQQCVKMRAQILKDIKGAYTMNYSSKSLLGRDEFLDAIEKIIAGFEFKVVNDNKNKQPKAEEISNDVVTDDQKETTHVSRPKMNGESQNHSNKEKIDSEKNFNRNKNNDFERNQNRRENKDRPHKNNNRFHKNNRNFKPEMNNK